MTPNKNRRGFLVVVVVLAVLVLAWLVANRDHFKAGLAGEPEPTAKTRP